MRENSGITLITLMIAILIIMILLGTTIYTGFEVLENAKVTGFKTELEIIHGQVNIAYEKISIGEDMVSNYGKDVDTLDNDTKNKINSVISTINSSFLDENEAAFVFSDFRYFSGNDLETNFGIENIEQDVIVNFNTRDVISLTGVEYKNKLYYRYTDLPGESKNIKQVELSTTPPEFDITKNINGLNATITISNIKYGEDVNKGEIYYGEIIDESTNQVDYYRKVTEGNTISINKTGNYLIKIENSLGISSTQKVNVALTNSPKLDEGMVPVIWNGTNWEITNKDSGVWYDYSEDAKKWANVMLQDGLQIASDGKTVQSFGSMFVWIPRYMYKISEGYHGTNSNEIEIKFLKGTSDIPTDNSYVNPADASGESLWNVHPSFCDGTTNDYANGEWDKEITGIWVAKFEASSNTPTASYGGGNNANLNVKVIPGVSSWRYIDISNMSAVCQKMNADSNIYGLTENAYPHLMKSSEWGAVVYLTQSKYGNMQTYSDSSSGVWNNPYHNGDSTFGNRTGCAGQSRDSTTAFGTATSVYSDYNTGNGPNASTTRNIYGIYDMAGGLFEKLMGFLVNSTTNTHAVNLKQSLEDKYISKLDGSGATTSAADRQINYEANSAKYGNAIWETSNGYANSSYNSWGNDMSTMPYLDHPFIRSGADFRYSTHAGIFAFYYTQGTADPADTFRPVIIVE